MGFAFVFSHASAVVCLYGEAFQGVEALNDTLSSHTSAQGQ